MRPPKLKASFVIPVRNGAAFLAETLESCIRQTEKGIEIIVVDDGSTDSTGKLLDYYGERVPRLRRFKFEESRGRSAARNYGVAQAKADIIMTLDADDLAYADRAKMTVQYLKKNPDVDIVYGAFHVMDELGNVQGGVEAHAFDFENVRKEGFTYICHSMMSFRKSVFHRVQYSEDDYSRLAIDDWKFQVDAHKAGFRFGHIPKLLGAYRIIPKERDEAKIKELKSQCLAA